MRYTKLLSLLVCAAMTICTVTGCSESTAESRSDTSSLSSSSVQSETVTTTTTATTQSQTQSTTQSDPSEPDDSKGDQIMNEVKILGRTYPAQDGILWMAQSGTGAEFEFTGSKLSVTMVASKTSEDHSARIGVFVDGVRTTDMMLSGFSSFDIDGKGDTPVTVSIIKLSECAYASCGIKALDPHGGKITPTAAKSRKIEFIGDSMTCGYGVDDYDLSHGFSTATEDCTKSYAFKTAQLLSADVSLVCFSGFGIVSGYTGTGEKNTNDLVPPYYDNYGYTQSAGFDGQDPASTAWDFSRFSPDVIVINLGTNDMSYTLGDPDRTNEFTQGYTAFLKQVRSSNSNTRMICMLGTMGNLLNQAMNDAVKQYSEQTGDKNISTLDVPVQDVYSDGCTIQSHPSEATYDKIAKQLSEKISADMGWK